jgi:CheY-like chemotaxis protein
MQKILIVEDVEYNLDLLVQLLEDAFQLVSAPDGKLGVEMTASERPDLILMDMSLPGMNGWTATRAIKDDPELAHIPIVGLSAHALSSERERALDAGCVAYLTKPIDEDLLFQTIERALKVAQER